MADMRLPLRFRGPGWVVLALAMLGVVLASILSHLHRRAEGMRQVTAAQEKLDQDMWRSITGAPVADLVDALGEKEARELMMGFEQAERRSLTAPVCNWRAMMAARRLLREEILPGDIVCLSEYDAVCRGAERVTLDRGGFYTVWRQMDGTWKLADARNADGAHRCMGPLPPILNPFPAN